MTRLRIGPVVLAVCVAALSCGDPTSNLRNGAARIVADPTALFLAQGEKKAVTVRVLDEQGNELADPVQISSFDPALVDVTIDSTYLPGTDTTSPGPIPSATRTRMLITGVGRNSGVVVITAGDQTLNLPVRVLPVVSEFDATFSNQAPALGETVTLTAPAGFHFDPDSGLTFASGPLPINVSVAADGSSLTFLPGPNTSGSATIAGVIPTYAPTLRLSVTTIETLATPIVDTLDATFSPTRAPAQNQNVVVTAPAGFQFTPTAALSVNGQAPIIVSRAPDGSSITFLPQPGSAGSVKVDSILISALPQFPLSLPIRDTIATAPLGPVLGGETTASAAAIPLGLPGETAGFFDAGAFTGADITTDGGDGAQYYKFTLGAAATVNITLDAVLADPSADDVDLVLCSDAACSTPNLIGATGATPESATYTLAAGTYYIAAVLFGGVPSQITITIRR